MFYRISLSILFSKCLFLAFFDRQPERRHKMMRNKIWQHVNRKDIFNVFFSERLIHQYDIRNRMKLYSSQPLFHSHPIKSGVSTHVWCCTRNESKLPEKHSLCDDTLLRPGVRGRGVLLTGRAFISAATSSSSAWCWRLLLDLQDSCPTTTNKTNNDNSTHHDLVL